MCRGLQEGGGTYTVKISPDLVQSVCLQSAEQYVRLESSIGTVDEVSIADLLQNQQGARLVALRE